MELLGRNADFGSKAKLPPVGKPGRSVDIHRGRIDRAQECIGRPLILGDNALAVAARITGDVINGLLEGIHHLDRKHIPQKFRRVILFGSGETTVSPRISRVRSQPRSSTPFASSFSFASGRNREATSRCTSRLSQALHTEGREVLAL